MYDHKKIAVVGQLVDIYERHRDNPNARKRFVGMTNYSLSELTKVAPTTIRRYMIELESIGYVTSDIEQYRNTTRTRYFPTTKACVEWNTWKSQEMDQIARSWVASNWMEWYKKHIRKVYRNSGLKSPFFRV
jgi:hypothetical protein